MKEIDFRDRVPTHPGRVKLTPVAGAEDTYTMERADLPIEPGTPIDKAMYESIIQSRLTGRYYSLDVDRIAVGQSADINTNPIPASGWVNSNFSLSTNGGYVARVDEGYGNYPSYAFDGNDGTSWVGAQNKTEHWLSLELPGAITAKKIALKVQVERPTNTPTIKIEGSNNNSTWLTLLTINETQTAAKEYTLNSPGEYKYYRVHLTYTAANTPEIYTFAIIQYAVNQYNSSYTIASGVPSKWTTGQRVTVQVSSAANTLSVISNTLNGVKVNTILQSGRRYELRYNGTTFDAKEV